MLEWFAFCKWVFKLHRNDFMRFWCTLLVDWLLVVFRGRRSKVGKFLWRWESGRWSNRRKREQCQLSGPCQPAALYESQSSDLHKWLFIASSRLWHTHKEFVNSKSVPAIETDQWAYRMRCVCIEGKHWIEDMGCTRIDLVMIKWCDSCAGNVPCNRAEEQERWDNIGDALKPATIWLHNVVLRVILVSCAFFFISCSS